MILDNNYLSPDHGMHIKHMETGIIYEGSIYIPVSSSENDFEEITHKQYLSEINHEEGDEVTQAQYYELSEQLHGLSGQVDDVQSVIDEILGGGHIEEYPARETP